MRHVTRAASVLSVFLLLTGCLGQSGAQDEQEDRVLTAAADGVALDTAIFAGGCFWCMEPPYDELDGVLSTTSGFVGGEEENPSYRDVVQGLTGHTEAVQVIWDPERVSYERLLAVFWVNVDPLDGAGQFCDRGPAYRPGIFPRNEAQQALAQSSRSALEGSDVFEDDVAVEVTPATPFWAAEDYHQAYYLKNPVRYRFYRSGCRRDERLDALWGSERTLPAEVRQALGLGEAPVA